MLDDASGKELYRAPRYVDVRRSVFVNVRSAGTPVDFEIPSAGAYAVSILIERRLDAPVAIPTIRMRAAPRPPRGSGRKRESLSISALPTRRVREPARNARSNPLRDHESLPSLRPRLPRLRLPDQARRGDAVVYQRIEAVEQEMRSGGAWMFSGRLTSTDDATVVKDVNGDHVVTDGPFVEAKEHLGGFYVIQAIDLDAALAWAKKVTTAVGAPIEVRPFFGLQVD